MRKPLILIFAILILDQILKIWIKLNLSLGEEIALIGDWCKIHFIKKISSSCPLNTMQKLKLMDSYRFKLFYEESFFNPFKVAI